MGLRAPHYREILATRPAIAWFEAHSENYFGEGGQPLAILDAIRAEYLLSLHGVGSQYHLVDHPIFEAHPLRRTGVHLVFRWLDVTA